MFDVVSIASLFRITVGASKRLVEVLQMLSARWNIDRVNISIYHAYSIGNHAGKYPDCRLSKDSDVLHKGEIIIVSWPQYTIMTV